MSIKQNITNLQSLLEQVNALPEAGSGGVELPELSNPGTASDLELGKELIDQDGNIVVGTRVVNAETWTLTLEDGSTVEKVVHIE